MSQLTPFYNTYRCTGAAAEDAEDLVLLHGWGLHSIVWDDVMPALLETFRVTVIDLPGMGQSPLPADEYSLDFISAHIEAVLPRKFHLLGWSLGGLVALALAAKIPERIQTLVTVACSPKYVVADDWLPAMPAAILDKFSQIYAEDNEGTLIRFLALNAKGSMTMKEDVKKLKDILFFCGLPAPRALREGLGILRDTDLRNTLAALTIPSLMIFGEQDQIVPVAVAAEIEARGYPVKISIIKGVSHVPFISAPDIFTEALREFWQGVNVT